MKRKIFKDLDLTYQNLIIIVLAISFAVLGSTGLILSTQVDPDELEHLHATWLWNKGINPYTDFFEHHTQLYWLPLMPVINIVEASNSIHLAVVAGRLVSLIILLLLLAASYFLFAEIFNRITAIYSTLLWAIFCAYYPRAIHIRPDMLMMLFLVLGTYFLLHGVGYPVGRFKKNIFIFLGGVGLALSILVLLKAVLWVLPIIIWLILYYWKQRSHQSYKAQLISLSIFISGMVIVFGLQLVWLISVNDISKFLFANITTNMQLGSVYGDPREIMAVIKRTISWVNAPIILVLLGFASFITQKKVKNNFSKILILLLLGGSILLTLLGNDPEYHYHFPLVWLLSGLSGFRIQIMAKKLSFNTRLLFDTSILALTLILCIFSFGPIFFNEGLKNSTEPLQYILDNSENEDSYLSASNSTPIFLKESNPEFFMAHINPRRSVSNGLQSTTPKFVVATKEEAKRHMSNDLLKSYKRVNKQVLVLE